MQKDGSLGGLEGRSTVGEGEICGTRWPVRGAEAERLEGAGPVGRAVLEVGGGEAAVEEVGVALVSVFAVGGAVGGDGRGGGVGR